MCRAHLPSHRQSHTKCAQPPFEAFLLAHLAFVLLSHGMTQLNVLGTFYKCATTIQPDNLSQDFYCQ